MLITYFTNVTTGLILDAIGVFAGFTYILYLSYTKGFEIPSYAYFWAIAYPLFTIVISLFARNTLELQNQVNHLSSQITELVIIDDLTGLKNEKGLIHDTDIYIKLATRYNHCLSLIVVEFRHKHEIERLVNKKQMNSLIQHISDVFKDALRVEDQVYLLDRDRIQWGLLLISNDTNSIKIVIERLKAQIASIGLEDDSKFNHVNIDMRMGLAIYEESIHSSIELLGKARAELEYDV